MNNPDMEELSARLASAEAKVRELKDKLWDSDAANCKLQTDLNTAEARLRAVTEALEEIAREGQGALNNAAPEDAPDVVAVLTGHAILALKAARAQAGKEAS